MGQTKEIIKKNIAAGNDEKDSMKEVVAMVLLA